MSGWSYTVQAGDSLVAIALRFYGDKAYWQKIYEANKDEIGSDPRSLRIGMTLMIPPSDSGGLILNEPGQMESHSQSFSEKDSVVSSLKVQNAIISDDYNGNHQKNTDSDSSKKEVERKRGWLERFNIGTPSKIFPGLIGFAFGLIGTLISVNNYQQKQPNLNILDPSIQTESPSDVRYPYLQDLYNLYWNTSGELDDGLEVFSRRFEEILSNSAGGVEVNSLESFQGSSEGQAEDLKELQGEVERVQSYYSDLRNDSDQASDIESIQAELSKVHGELESGINGSTDSFGISRLAMFLTIENRSEIPNLIRGESLLVIYDDPTNVLELPLTVEPVDEEDQSNIAGENGNAEDDNNKRELGVLRSHTLAANDAVVFQAMSSEFGSLSDEDQSRLREAIREGYNYRLVLRDVHNKTYSTGGELSSFRSSQNLEVLRNEAERSIQGGTRRVFPF